jgi:hypothetical protein
MRSFAGSHITGPIARAKATQIGLSCETVPSAEVAVPPLRTAAVRCRKQSRSGSASRNSIAPPRYAGEWRFRKAAASGVSSYWSPARRRNPTIVR